MENSAEKPEHATEPGSAEIGKRELRSVRRRLVQSTLLPHKPQELEDSGDRDQETEKEKDCGEDEEICGSQERKKRKATVKTTPRKRSAKKSKEKQSVNLTPKKILHNEETSPSIPDLRLEAKMSAEEHSRMFAGRQIHPFFSSRKAGKKSLEASPLVERGCTVERKDSGIDCNPIHVFERTGGDEVFLDWRNWTFLDGSFINNGHILHSTSSPVFEGSIKSLSLDDLPIGLQPSDSAFITNKEPMDQGSIDQECIKEIILTAGNQDKSCGITDSDAKEHHSRFLQDRMQSYHLGCQSHPKNCLWTYKYQPKMATEVCGNHESVKFLNEWLHLWSERNSQSKRDFAVGDQSQKQNINGNCSQSDSDYESSDEEDTLKNVLLLTGLSGSGKSAAIYACAEEHGFRVFEFSASVIRSGAVLKQMIGEALQSHQLKRSVINSQGLRNKFIEKSLPSLPEGTADKDLANEVIELIPLSVEDSKDNIKGAGEFEYVVGESYSNRREAKALILLEDVDIIFLEDRGFISSIQEIAETGKRPIILTSNSSNPVLPDNLDRLQVSFTRPSSKELLSHLYMICASEGVNIQPHLLQRIIECCHRDIRKIITHLQFWCQGRGFRDKSQKKYGSLLFDLDASHQILPMTMPWNFPSQLSELVDKEITESLLRMETGSCFLEASVSEFCEGEMLNGIDCQNYEDGFLDAKKIAMLNRNGSIQEHDKFSVQFDAENECSDTSGTSVPLYGLKRRRRLDMVVSSDSEDEPIHEECFLVPHKDENMSPSCCPASQNFSSPLNVIPMHEECSLIHKDENMSPSCYPASQNFSSLLNVIPMHEECSLIPNKDESMSPSCCPTSQNFSIPLNVIPMHEECSLIPNKDESMSPSCCPASQNFSSPLNVIPFLRADMNGDHYPCSETAGDVHINVICKSVDISCTPESSFVPETEVAETELFPETMSGGHAAASPEVSVNEFFQNVFSVEANSFNSHTQTAKATSALLRNTCDVFNFSNQEGEGFSCNLHVENTTRGYSVMDECSRVDFNKSKFVEKPEVRVPVNLVHESWKQLRLRRADLRHHIMSEKQGTFRIIELVHRMSHLISDSDLLLSFCQPQDILETPTFVSEDSFCWGGQQLHMASTIAQHGFCFFANGIATAGSHLGFETKLDIVSEMLTSASNPVALGKLIRCDVKKYSPTTRKNLELSPTRNSPMLERSMKSRLFDTIQHVVPGRSHLALKGDPFFEYLSSLRCISRSETSRISKGIDKTKRQRGRVARHYLSTGSLPFSPEDITLLGQSNLPYEDIHRC